MLNIYRRHQPPLLQALNTGHAGSLSTIHASSARRALGRLASCALQSGVDLPYPEVRRAMSECIQVVVQIERHAGHRAVTELGRVVSYEAERDCYSLDMIG